MRAQWRWLAVVVTAAWLATAIASAEPGGSSGVYGPSVTKGESELEIRSGYFNGGALDGTLAHRLEAGHAFTDWWQSALVLKLEDDTDRGLRGDAVAIENVFDLKATRDWPVHLGLYAEYSFAASGEDEVELKLLAERKVGNVTARANLIAERHVGNGARDDWDTGYAVRLDWKLENGVSLGAEGFGSFTDESHYLGPRFAFPIRKTNSGELKAAVGFLQAVSDGAADNQLRLTLEYEF